MFDSTGLKTYFMRTTYEIDNLIYTFQVDAQARLTFNSTEYDGQAVYAYHGSYWLGLDAGPQVGWSSETGVLTPTNTPVTLYLQTCQRVVDKGMRDVLFIGTAVESDCSPVTLSIKTWA
ncbi:b12ff039-de51-4cf7-b0b2-ebbfaa7f135e [Thermothielavioides terrestris]|uniref:B12ff039-de51-4cf7-b0b2-ebbfaa7f135e n=1 Tax=Thermothielavioides terrestris TaxID=2587410 RepID=A0A446BP42_9PEZI|nr:b12ff039-de51-4cf7-b0b2-ebbfaa7f135e [Thermothielavioides terrestris]